MVEIIKFIGGNMAAALSRAKDAIISGKVVVYPTDTVYGIGGDALNHSVVEKVRRIKGIGKNKPLSVMMTDLNMIDEYCEIGLWEEIILKKYLPGPFTFVLKSRKKLSIAPGDTIGVRVPESEFCNRLCEAIGKPVITTSANRTGDEPPVVFEEIDRTFLEQVDIAIDSGPTRYGRASDVVDLVNKKIIRKGVGVIDLSIFPEK